jgi:alkylation response protein AidB-like acyl-CoA dehydrogenase
MGSRQALSADVLADAGELGLGGLYVREDVGGTALTREDAALVFEQLSMGDPTIAAYISIHNMVAWMIDSYGTRRSASSGCRV